MRHTVTPNPTPADIATVRQWQNYCYEQFTFDCTKTTNNYRQLFFDEYQRCVKWLRSLHPSIPAQMGYEYCQPVFDTVGVPKKNIVDIPSKSLITQQRSAQCA